MTLYYIQGVSLLCVVRDLEIKLKFCYTDTEMRILHWLIYSHLIRMNHLCRTINLMTNKGLSKLGFNLETWISRFSLNLVLFLRVFRYSDASSVGLCYSERTEAKRVWPMARSATRQTET